MKGYKEASYYDRIKDNHVKCRLCPHECTIGEGKRGMCRARHNKEGRLYTENYGRISSIAMDPIEKKPLYHFYPGKYILSIGTFGCNFRCSFCQNHHIAQQDELSTRTEAVNKEYLLNLCREEEECIGIAYTYNEPSIWYEFVLETAAYMKEASFKNVLVTNGYISKEPLLEILPHIDAMNIDVKGFTEGFYSDVCKGSLKHVRSTVEEAAQRVHVEVTTLVIPGRNDSPKEIGELARWLSSINPSIPLHLSRYFPRYMMNEQPTSVSALLDLKAVAAEHLEYVYVGNVGGETTNTYCPRCGALLVKRSDGLFIEHLDDGICSKCGEIIKIEGL